MSPWIGKCSVYCTLGAFRTCGIHLKYLPASYDGGGEEKDRISVALRPAELGWQLLHVCMEMWQYAHKTTTAMLELDMNRTNINPTRKRGSKREKRNENKNIERGEREREMHAALWRSSVIMSLGHYWICGYCVYEWSQWQAWMMRLSAGLISSLLLLRLFQESGMSIKNTSNVQHINNETRMLEDKICQ